MHLLIREFRPAHVLELGTNLGISAAYLASALKINGQGRVVTIELAPDRVDLARQVHTSLGLDNVSYVCGRFADTLGPALDDLVSVELAFIDGHYQMQPTLDYFERISRHASSDALFVFDDIRWSPGMWRAWKSLRADARIRVGVDMLGYAICAGGPRRFAGTEVPCRTYPVLIQHPASRLAPARRHLAGAHVGLGLSAPDSGLARYNVADTFVGRSA